MLTILYMLFFCATSLSASSIVERQIGIFQQNPMQVTGLEHLNQQVDPTPRVTIWVHGTTFMNFISNFVHTPHRDGLVHHSELPWNFRLKNIFETLSASNPQRFPLEHCYAFGWSGALSFEKRKKEGENLYIALKNLISAYKAKYKEVPHITFITHSHGGNVVLNVPNFIEKNFNHSVTAIFLGIPVQHETKEIIHNKFFQRIYSFYSYEDWIQAGDPQGLYINQINNDRHWELSDRTFCFDRKLSQVHLKVNGTGIWHLGYIRNYFVNVLPRLINEIDTWETQSPSTPRQERVLHVNFYS